MRNYIIIILLLACTNLLIAQVQSDSIKITSNNCATIFGQDYMLKINNIDSIKYKNTPLRVRELLKESMFEEEVNGVFLISSINPHKKNLIFLKKNNQIKFLTFNDISKSLIELILFLEEIESNDKDLLEYIDLIQLHIQSSKKAIKTNNIINDSDWIDCADW